MCWVLVIVSSIGILLGSGQHLFPQGLFKCIGLLFVQQVVTYLCGFKQVFASKLV